MIPHTHSGPYAALSPVSGLSVAVTGGFWASVQRRNLELTLPTQYHQLASTGHFDNFRRAAGGDGAFSGRCAGDSDVYRWLEAASWTLGDPTLADLQAYDDLQTMVDTVVDLIVAAQGTDGYLNTCFAQDRAAERWQDLRDGHELYCAGHLIQAAIAHARTTQRTVLLETARRLADLICDTFGPGEGQRPGAPGHPNIEMALVALARTTRERRYTEQAAYFLNARGHGLIGGRYHELDHTPFRDLERLTGHAVRAGYLAAGATDLYAETGDPALLAALTRIWTHMRTRQMYITGGLGSRHRYEAIGADYELPNARAYAETCAAIGNVNWAWRMLQLEGAPTYADVMERALYNAVLPGIALDGQHYFYTNPLASDDAPEPGHEPYRRRSWFDCACCPTNLARTVAMMPSMLYSTAENAIWVHHYAAGEADIELPDQRTIKLIQRTRYPWDGQVIVEMLTPGTYSVNVRIPGWCNHREERYRPTVAVNGGACPGDVQPGQYVTIARTWAVGDTVCIQLPMPIRRIAAHPYALENAGRVALMRGPLLYCVEAIDHPQVRDLRDLALDPRAQLHSRYRSDLLGGVQVIEGEAALTPPADAWSETLYRETAHTSESAPETAHAITAIPYFAWANRQPGAMQIWLRERP
jgi:uncharacterized protein